LTQVLFFNRIRFNFQFQIKVLYHNSTLKD